MRRCLSENYISIGLSYTKDDRLFLQSMTFSEGSVPFREAAGYSYER